MSDERPDPDALLRDLDPSEGSQKGRLKIFFGYAAGVGKTYAMLEAAHRAKDAGVDVEVGYIEPHTRPETLALLPGLEQLPPRLIPYKGITLREFDLDAALARIPQLLLVDELAHTNAQGSRHVKRYQDIEELLRAGISVYTTVNVQHLESLHDVVAAITGVSVGERVPDHVFDAADQVEVVDIEPADLLDRLREGKIYRPTQARQAMDHFFSQKNLAALREIALRRTADRLNRSSGAAGEPSRADEHVLTCLSPSPSNAKVIRTAARMADAFRSDFTALFVETPEFPEQSPEDRQRLRSNLRLAEDLGARIATAYGDDPAVQIAEYAKTAGVSKIVLGRSNRRRTLRHRGRSLVDRLTGLAPDLDIYIIPDHQPPYRPPGTAGKSRALRFSWPEILKMLGILALCTLVGYFFTHLGFTTANVIMVYILGVLCVSMATTGRSYSLIASALSVLIFNFFFTYPYFTLFSDPSYIATFGVMFVVAFFSSSLTTRIKRQAVQAAQKAYRTQVLLETSQRLQKSEGEDGILDVAAEQLRKLLERTILLYPVDAAGVLGQPKAYPFEGENIAPYLSAEERAAACWVQKNNKHAGATTNTLPGARCLYLAVRGEQRVLAVAAVAVAGRTEPDAFGKNLMLSILDECGLVLEKARLDRDKREMEARARQEALRANLLRAISHDLRTPLTSISGSAGILMENSSVLNGDKKRALYTSIYDDSMWLTNLVENLLSVTRIENGTMSLRTVPELLDEVFQEALSHLDRHAAEHQIVRELPDDMLMARMDARLIVQVIINLVNNAVKYTPPGSHITVSAVQRPDGMVEVRVADDGPGIGDEAKEKLFDMFYTANNTRGDGRRGMGLGLSLCKSIVSAHGGTISVTDNRPHGAVFTFTLQSAEVSTIE